MAGRARARQPTGGHDDLLVVADAVDFCRLAANRLSPVELAPYVEGDEAVAADVFEGIRALAVD